MGLLVDVYSTMIRFFVCILALHKILSAAPIVIESNREYEVLSQFFKTNILEEDFGFVLEGVKPLAFRNYYPLHEYPLYRDQKRNEEAILQMLLLIEAAEIWNKKCSFQKNFILKITHKKNTSILDGCEVLFINKKKLTQTIAENLVLFQYVLDPMHTAESLVETITSSSQRLDSILCEDSALMGIVLGFGTYNSIVEGKIASIEHSMFSEEMPPFVAKSNLIQGESAASEYSAVRHGITFFEPLRPNRAALKRENGEREIQCLRGKEEMLPGDLLEKRPRFVFGAYRSEISNQPLFEKLLATQKSLQKMVGRPDFLERVLTVISEAEPKVLVKRDAEHAFSLSFFKGVISSAIWREIISKIDAKFTEKVDKEAFLAAFSKNCSVKPPEMIGVNRAIARAMSEAVNALYEANEYFDAVSMKNEMTEVYPKMLYYQTLSSGSGPCCDSDAEVRIEYTLETVDKTVLSAGYDVTMTLSSLMQGFAHGCKGMREGETRSIYIHPRLGYGALTSLPRCKTLIAKVRLKEIVSLKNTELPTLKPYDLGWLEEKKYQEVVQRSADEKPSFSGAFFRSLIQKIEGQCFELIPSTEILK